MTGNRTRNDRLLTRAIAMHQAGEIEPARRLYSQILESDPEHEGALHFAGIAAHQSGDHKLAIELMERSLEKGSVSPDRYLNFGQVLEASCDVDRALACYQKAIALDPKSGPAHVNLGKLLLEVDRPAEAEQSFREALRWQGQSYEAFYGLGMALEKTGQLEPAISFLQKAIALQPESIPALNNRGVALCALGRLEEAVACYRLALQHAPQSAEVLVNLAEALRQKGDLDESIRLCKQAMEIQPAFAVAYTNLAAACNDKGLLSEGVANYRKAIELDPRNARAYGNLAGTLSEQDNPAEALMCYAKAIELAPAKYDSFSNLLCLYSTFQFASPQAECELAANWEMVRLSEGERAAARARAAAGSGAFSTQPRNGRPLRLGIVSAELGRHAVATFLRPFLDHLDPRRVHLTLFPTLLRQDPLADHFRSLAKDTIPLFGIPDAQAADIIRQQQIDVLIDTTGHTGHCRLGIFAHRAAPVQCSYIGYWSTTGLTEMDWYITDPDYSRGCETHFTEKLWRLPHRAHCYYPDESLPPSAWVPDPTGTVWLGSFNRYNKIRRETLALWAKVLKALPQAKLLLEDRASCQAETHQRIRAVLSENNVVGDRVIFLPTVQHSNFAAHMRLYDRLDVALDTIPANSGTTAFDALWMGVPLVALEGTRVCSRMAASILRGLNKPDWIATNHEEYVSKVSALALDVERRATLRKTLRSEMKQSSLCDGKGLARALEDALEAMHDQWMLSYFDKGRGLSRVP